MRGISILATVTLASCCALAGCRRQADPPAEPIAPDSAVTEEGENGTVAWNVESDGKIHGTVKAKDGHAVTKDIIGTLIWPGEVADEERDIALDENGGLVASGPPLEDDLTEIDYSLTVEGKSWTGALHVPRGGTKAIEDDAKAAAQLTVPQGKTGPNGGTIQYVGNQPVELVADSNSREVRLYVLDSTYSVIDPGERTFRIGYAADYSGMQVLVREPGANYYVGPWYAGYNPYRVTVAMTFGREVHVGIVGWRYGERLRWGVYAPIAFVGVRSWAPSYTIRTGYGRGWGWGGGYGRGGPRGRGGEPGRGHGIGRGDPGGHGSGHGTGHGSGHGSEPGGGHASGHGSEPGGGHGSGHGSEPGGGHGSGHGSEPGGGHASGHGSEPGGGHGSEPGGGHGSHPGGAQGGHGSGSQGGHGSPPGGGAQGGHGSGSQGGHGSNPGGAHAPARPAPHSTGGTKHR